MINKYFGTVLTEELATAPLKMSERLVLGYIKSFRQYCPHHNAIIAERLGISKRTVAYAIAKLKKSGIICVEKQNNNNYKRRIFINSSSAKIALPTEKNVCKNNRETWRKKCAIVENPVENSTPVKAEIVKDSAKIALPLRKNCTTHNREDSAKIALYKNNKNNNKNDLREEVQQNPSFSKLFWGLAKAGNSRTLFRDNFKSEYDFQEAFYRRNTLSV